MEFYKRNCYWGINELYPNIIRYLFEKPYENGSQQLEPILELLRGYSLENYRNMLGISKKISNYSELARSITESFEKNNRNATWKVRALAKLETYLIQHGQKIDYSIK